MPLDRDGGVSDLPPRRIQSEAAEQGGGTPSVYLVGPEPATTGLGGQPAGGRGLGGRVVGDRARAGFEPAGKGRGGRSDLDPLVAVDPVGRSEYPLGQRPKTSNELVNAGGHTAD